MIPKFRGKRKDNGEWVVGVPIPNSFCNVVHMIPILLTDKVAYPPERLHEYLIEIVPETLMQSTGLKDKNGVEIFEGDLVEHDDNLNGDWETFEACEVVYDKDYAQFCFKWDAGNFLTDYRNLNVIGNIYENPELSGDEQR
ncbi:TPA: YopX family protein [Enterococcus faecium]